MYVNIIEAYRNIVAIADAELIGKKFFEGKKQLDIKESFYKGKLHSPEEVSQEIRFWAKEDATFNIVGKKSIKIALKEGIIHEDSVGTIDGIPYALVLL
jgi:hypothetical protein